MARRTKRNRRTRRTRRKSTISKLERSLRKTIERSIRKSLKKLTNRKTKKKKRKTKRKKKLQRGGTVEDQELLIGIFNNKYLDGPSIKDNQFVLTTPITTRVGLNEAMQLVLLDYSQTQVDPVLGSHEYQGSLGAQGSGNLAELDVRKVLALIFKAVKDDPNKVQIGQMSVELSDFKVKGGALATYQGLLREMSGELHGYYETLIQARIAPVAAPVAVPAPLPAPVQQEPVPVQQGPELEPVQQEQQEPELEPEQVAQPNRGLLFDPEAGLASPVAEEDDEGQAAAKIQAAERGRNDRQAYTQKRAAAATIQAAERQRQARLQQQRLEEEQRAAIAQQQQEQAQQQAAQEPPPAVPPPAVPPPPAPEPPPAPAGVGVVAAGSNCKEIQENITMLQQKIKTLEDDKRRLQEAIGARTGAGGAGDAGSAAALVASQQELARVQQSLAQVQAELDQCIQQKDFLMNELKKLIKELYCSILTKVRISRLVKAAAAHLLPEPLRRDIGLGEYNHLTYEFVLHALLSDNLLNNLSRGLPGPPILTPEERNEILQAEGLVAIPDGAQEMVGRVHGSLLNHIRLSRLGPVA
jgi:hypothetical protein